MARRKAMRDLLDTVIDGVRFARWGTRRWLRSGCTCGRTRRSMRRRESPVARARGAEGSRTAHLPCRPDARLGDLGHALVVHLDHRRELDPLIGGAVDEP